MSQTTKRALEASLKKLLLEKPLNKITINDITEDCGVNRMTFYYHFKDIYDLVDWILVEDAAKALEGFADRECRDITVQDDDKQFVVDFYKYALVGVVLEWVRRDMKTDPAVIVERMGRMLQGDMRRALCRLASNKIHMVQEN